MRTKKQIREGKNAVTREELRKLSNPDHNSGCLKPGEVYVCRECYKIGYSKTEMGSCIGHQVKVSESAVREALLKNGLL